jgi:uncharacterized protein (TIGR02598 family)
VKERLIRVGSFSLVEVVVALGVVAVGIVAIIGILPIGLDTSHAAQDNTRAPQIAQSIFATLTAQSVIIDPNTGQAVPDTNKNQQLNTSVLIPNVTNTINLATTSSVLLYANNAGEVSDSKASATYAVTVKVDNSPAGFGVGSAAQVTVSVAWPLSASAKNQVNRDFVRVVSRY